MGYVGTWLHDHHWATAEHHKTDRRSVLFLALAAVVACIVVMLVFPGVAY